MIMYRATKRPNVSEGVEKSDDEEKMKWNMVRYRPVKQVITNCIYSRLLDVTVVERISSRGVTSKGSS